MKRIKTKIIIISAFFACLIAFVISLVYAEISKTSTRGQIEVSSVVLTANTTYTSSTNSFNWTFTEAGDTKEITVSTTNQSGTILHNVYNISGSGDSNLLAAIMVYYNDEYIGQLSEIINLGTDIESEFVFIPLAATKTDSLKFELHQAAKSSIFDSKSISFTLTTYTENADFTKYIFVNNEDTFKHAIDDVNSDLFDEIPTIVLCNTITLEEEYTITNPVTFYLNGCTLNGDLVLNSADALIEVKGNGTFNANVTLTNYDEDGALDLVKNEIETRLGEGVLAGSTTNILGNYGFYGLTIAAGSNCTYSNGSVSIANTSAEYYTKVASITVDGETVEFKALGSKTSLLDNTLSYLPSNGTVITSDLFLPAYLKDQNATITWKSSDEAIITNDGKITAERLENAEVKLYAEIKVNDRVLTRIFDFKVSAHNNEINFYKLVQEISPLVITNVYGGPEDTDDALYYLPIVSQNNDGTFNDYDYRTSFVTPVNTEMFNWTAYKDIGLESITYSMTQEQLTNYDYITQSNNTVYLNTVTLNSYASITITGDFGNSETYSTNINISIAVGSNTQLLEKAFTQVSEELEDISVLGNILSTRISDGMANEKGDFSLSATYAEDSDYTIEFSGAQTIIDSITYNSTTDKYDFAINPEYFNEYETTVAFTATVYYKKGQTGETNKSRTFYITVPAALHIDDFGTISIYNSSKYQVYNQLPASEKTSPSGYSTTGVILTDSNLNYVLLRDIVGDADYLTQYGASDLYLEKINYTATSQYAQGVKTLTYNVNNQNNTSATDTAAYDFIKLIQWATSKGRVAASTIVSNTAALNGLGSTKSNNAEYLNDSEIAVLKACYQYYTGASDSVWNSIYNEVLSKAPGYIYTNSSLLSKVISCLQNNSISWTSENYGNLFGKYMEILQRYALSTTKVNTNDVAPCQQQYNSSYVWYHSKTAVSSFTLYNYTDNRNYTFTPAKTIQTVNDGYWYRATWNKNYYGGGSGGDGVLSGFFATADFKADRTSYITEAELQVVLMFWLNAAGNNLDTAITTTNLDAIEAVLTADNGDYYSDYSRSNFTTVGTAILNGFYSCIEIPTYFSTDGISKIIKYFYNNYNRNSTKYELPSYDGTVTATFKSVVDNSIPYVTNLDNIKSALSYFINLEQLTINGAMSLSAFLSENGISTMFARVGYNNTKITRLVMKYCAHDYVNFDLSNINSYKSLTYLDLSNNMGIQSVNELVNVNRGNYTYVNISRIGVEYDYQEFAIDNIATSSCTVYYTNASNVDTYSNNSTNASVLADLSDFNKFITKYMYMTNVIYNENGTTTTVNWRIDEGNEINSAAIENSGDYPSISTFDEMNQLISPYYYCSQSFTYKNMSFVAGNLYKVTYNGTDLEETWIGEYDSTNQIDPSSYSFDTTVPDYSWYEPNYEVLTTKNVTTAGTVSYSNKTDWLLGSTYQKTQKVSKNYTYVVYDRSTSGGTYYQRSLPSEADLKTAITNANSDLTITNIDLNVQIAVVSYNTNGSSSFNDSWQHGLCTGGTIRNSTLNNTTVIDYTTGLIHGGEYYTFTTLTSKSYLGTTFYIAYNNNKGSERNPRYYPSSSATWKLFERQIFDSITISISCEISHSVTYDSTIEINYNDGTSDVLTGYYAAGSIIKRSVGTTIIYTETQKTVYDYDYGDDKYIYYTGDNVTVYDENGDVVNIKPNTLLYVYVKYHYPVVSRERTYQIVGEVYTVDFWYIKDSWNYDGFNSTNTSWYHPNQHNDSDSGIIDGESIYSITINGTTYYDFETLLTNLHTTNPNNVTRTNLTGFDVDWEDVPLESSWALDDIYVSRYIDYVSNITSSNKDALTTQDYIYQIIDDVDCIYEYSGPTTQELVYYRSLTGTLVSYTHNYGYMLSINNGSLEWNYYSTSVTNPTGTTMDSILATANQHFTDNQYGYYYGRYYAYSGAEFYAASGTYYENGCVYRIMPNSTNTAFVWVKIGSYFTGTSGTILQRLGTGVAGEGDIFYSTESAFGFFDPGFYKVVLDEKTNVVNLVKFNDMGISISTNYSQITNDKLVPKGIGDGQDYLGYSGTFTVQISALIRVIDNGVVTKEYIKTYKLKFVGSLTS